MERIKLDSSDIKILEILQNEGRLPNNELANRIGLTPTPTLERVRRLEREGIIKGYCARLDKEAVGKGMMVFVTVTLSIHQLKLLEEFTKAVLEIPEILTCYNITGEGDFLLQVVVKDTKHYERFMREKLATLPDVQRLNTTIVLNTIKEESVIPVNLSDYD